MEKNAGNPSLSTGNPNLCFWMKKISGNPTCGTEKIVVEVFYIALVLCFFYFVAFFIETFNYFVLLLVCDLMTTSILQIPSLGGSFHTGCPNKLGNSVTKSISSFQKIL